MIVLAYLWPLAVVPLLAERDDAEVQWHARHGLVLMAAELLFLVAFSILSSIISFGRLGLGCVLSLLVVLIWIAILAIHVVAILKGLNGKRLIVPRVSAYADRF